MEMLGFDPQGILAIDCYHIHDYDTNTFSWAYTYSPPEPATFVLCGAGVLTFVILQRLGRRGPRPSELIPPVKRRQEFGWRTIGGTPRAGFK
jgi:hypothetical protein